MEISIKFANLPNGIIREIIEYTGATYKKRNGKYMGQIPKNDPRFAILSKIPKKHMDVIISDEFTFFITRVVLFKNDRNDIYTIQLHVSGLIHKNGQTPICAYDFIIDDGNNTARRYTYCLDEKFIEHKKRRESIEKWMVILDRLWWISFGYFVASGIRMAMRYKSSQK